MTPHNSHKLGLALCVPADFPGTYSRMIQTLETLADQARSDKHRYTFLRVFWPRPGNGGDVSGFIFTEGTEAAIRAHMANCEAVDVVNVPTVHDKDLEHLLLFAKRLQITETRPEPKKVWQSADPFKWLGMTIITPGFDEVGREAVRRFQSLTGLPFIVLRAPSADAAYRLKLRLPDLIGSEVETVIFFDADWWLLRPLDLVYLEERLGTHPFLAVHDPGIADPAGFVAKDCADHGLNPARYFNSGFWVVRTTPEWKHVCKEAINLMGCEPFADFGEQSAFNHAWQNLTTDHIGLLPREYNFFMHAVTHGYAESIPAAIIGLHAAGVPRGRKLEHLKKYAAALDYSIKPLAASGVEEKPVIEKPAVPVAPVTWKLGKRTFTPPRADTPPAVMQAMISEALNAWCEPDLTRDQKESADCFLGYRYLEGKIGREGWNLDIILDGNGGPLESRWWCSKSYLSLLICIHDGQFQRLEPAWLNFHEWEEHIKKWPPQSLNAIKAAVLLSYWAYLVERSAPADYPQRVAKLGWDCWQALRHPYFPTEQQDALRVLQIHAFLQRQAGRIDFPDQPWCPLEKLRLNTPFDKAMVRLSALNPERALGPWNDKNNASLQARGYDI